MGNITWYEPVLDNFLNQPTGQLGRNWLKPMGRRILVKAALQAGVDTGDLKRRLYMFQGRRGRFQYLEVGSKSSHAWIHHEGTKPHLILPETGRLLRFNVGGQVVYARKVLNKGTRPNRYLVDPMRREIKR